MKFEETFGAKLASSLWSRASAARLLAAPGIDPDYFPYLVKAGARPEEKPRVRVFVVNLGNDLDELLYARSGVLIRPFDAASNWLGRRSFVYTDAVLVTAALRRNQTQPLPGLSVVIMETTPLEQLVLAEAVATSIAEAAVAQPGSLDMALIIPSDTQMFPSELQKYRRFYRPDAYSRMSSLLETQRRRMDSFEKALTDNLQQRGLHVPSVRSALWGMPAQQLFDRNYHHLTPLAHAKLASLLAAEIKRADRQ